MTTLLVTHQVFAEHLTDPGHPERPERIEAVWRAMDRETFAALPRREAPPVAMADLTLAHPPDHVARVLARMPEQGLWNLDADTIASPRSGEAALHAAGAVVLGVDAVLGGEADNAFCAVRPPGHHAETASTGGFCLFNNVAVAALAAQARHGLARVAVVDFDVHHGNGTQEIFWNRAGLFYASTHQSPLYPGTGRESETGKYGTIVNVPLAAGTNSCDFRAAYAKRILPALRAFAPELILISAGFDAHRDDPLGGLDLGETDFNWLARQLNMVARSCCAGRLVAALEGGYNLPALEASVAAFLEGLISG